MNDHMTIKVGRRYRSKGMAVTANNGAPYTFLIVAKVVRDFNEYYIGILEHFVFNGDGKDEFDFGISSGTYAFDKIGRETAGEFTLDQKLKVRKTGIWTGVTYLVTD